MNVQQEQAIKEWAADDRLWTTQDTVDFNLRTFAREILKLAALREPGEPGDKRLPDVVAEMRHRATGGCTGRHDVICCDRDDDIHPEDWCDECLMGVAAKEAERSQPSSPLSGEVRALIAKTKAEVLRILNRDLAPWTFDGTEPMCVDLFAAIESALVDRSSTQGEQQK